MPNCNTRNAQTRPRSSGISPKRSSKWVMHAAPGRVQKTQLHHTPTAKLSCESLSGEWPEWRVGSATLMGTRKHGISWDSSAWWNSLEKLSIPCVGILLSALRVPLALDEAELHKGPLRAEWDCPHEKYAQNSYCTSNSHPGFVLQWFSCAEGPWASDSIPPHVINSWALLPSKDSTWPMQEARAQSWRKMSFSFTLHCPVYGCTSLLLQEENTDDFTLANGPGMWVNHLCSTTETRDACTWHTWMPCPHLCKHLIPL